MFLGIVLLTETALASTTIPVFISVKTIFSYPWAIFKPTPPKVPTYMYAHAHLDVEMTEFSNMEGYFITSTPEQFSPYKRLVYI